MASNSIKGITIKISGDTSELTKSLDTVTRTLRTTQSQLRTVDKALKLDPTNVEALATKQELLNTAIAQTKQKLELERQAAEDAKKALELGNISESEYNTLRAEVAKTSSELNKLEREADELGQTMDSANNEIEGTGDALEETGNKAEKSKGDFDGWGKAIETAANVGKVAIEAVAATVAAVSAAAVAGTKALIDCTVEGARFADEVLTTASVTGMATDEIQAFSYAAELLDVSLDTITGAMARNVAGMNAGKDAYEELGVSVTDANGNLRDSETVFWETLDALAEVSNETERDALAMELFGRSAQDLNPLIEAGSDRIQELAEQARESGYVMSGETLNAYGQFDDALQTLDANCVSAKNAIGTLLLPILTDLAEDGGDLLAQFARGIQDANGDAEAMTDVFNEMLPQVLELITSYIPKILELAGTVLGALLDGIISNLPQILQTAVTVLNTLISGILSALPTAAPAMNELLVGLVDLILDNIGLLLDVAFELVMALVDGLVESKDVLAEAVDVLITKIVEFIQNNLAVVVDAAIQIVLAIVNGIVSAIPSLIPAVVQCVIQIVSTLMNNLDELISAGIDLCIAIGLGMIEAIPDLITYIPTIISAVLNAFEDLPTTLSNSASVWAFDMMQSFAQGVRNNISNVVSAVSEVASSVQDYIGFSEPKKGPLSNFHTFAPDMIDLFTEGIDNNLPQLQSSVDLMANTVSTGVQTDYSSVLEGISGQLSSFGGQIVVPVYIGNQLLGNAMASANARNNLISGGR